MDTNIFLEKKEVITTIYREIIAEAFSQLIDICRGIGVTRKEVFAKLASGMNQAAQGDLEVAKANASLVRLLLTRDFNPIIGDERLKEVPQQNIATHISILFSTFSEYQNALMELEAKYNSTLGDDDLDQDQDSSGKTQP